MNTTKKLFVLSMGLLGITALAYSFKPSESTLEYATMRTTEFTLSGQSSIILVYEGKTEELELDKVSPKNMASNTFKINQAIRLLSSKGFELVSQSGGDYISMYSFVRK